MAANDQTIRVDVERLGTLLRWVLTVLVLLWLSGLPAVCWLSYRLGYTAAVADMGATL